MCPKLDLNIADLLHGTVHVREKLFEFYNIRELRVNMFMFDMILLYKLFNDIFVSEYSKLLLERWLLLLGDIQFNNRGMNVFHNLVLIE